LWTYTERTNEQEDQYLRFNLLPGVVVPVYLNSNDKFVIGISDRTIASASARANLYPTR
jgi:hypothetical protein